MYWNSTWCWIDTLYISYLFFPSFFLSNYSCEGVWHPGNGKKTVLVWDPDEEVEYETGSEPSDSDEDEDGSDVEVVYEYVDEDGNVVEEDELDEEEKVKMEASKAAEEKAKKDKKAKKEKKKKEGRKKKGVKKVGEKKGGKLTKAYEDDFLSEKRKKKKKTRTKSVQVGEFSEATKKLYVDQAKFFLNAFWNDVQEDAEKVIEDGKRK